MTNDFDALAAAEQMKQAGFNGRRTKAVVGSIVKSRNGMATKRDVSICWQVILGVAVPLLLLNIGLSVSIALK